MAAPEKTPAMPLQSAKYQLRYMDWDKFKLFWNRERLEYLKPGGFMKMMISYSSRAKISVPDPGLETSAVDYCSRAVSSFGWL